jgi:large subunit ribosomal protein L35
MPKIKTAKGAKARFKVTGTGKLMGYQAGRRHLLGHKRTKVKRQMRKWLALSPGDQRKVKALIPYA